MNRDRVLDRFVEVKPSVKTIEEAAGVMGMSFAALDKALERARARGDERGIYKPLGVRNPKPPKPSRAEQILSGWVALAEPRPPYPEAAALIGCSTAALATTLSRYRRDGVEVPPPGPRRGHPRKVGVRAPRIVPTAPPAGVDKEVVLEDWADLRDIADEHWERAATRLGLTKSALAGILLEARRNGDPRGYLTTTDARRQEAS